MLARAWRDADGARAPDGHALTQDAADLGAGLAALGSVAAVTAEALEAPGEKQVALRNS